MKHPLILGLLSLLILGGVGYWFFMHTNRGSSLALYAFGGLHAPLSVKWECAMTTDLWVEEKFSLPLAFDEKTKDSLRGFWYYSYYRQCLFDHGYDFDGRQVPQSTLGSGGDYTNPYLGISFTLPTTLSLVTDNKLDVDLNDKKIFSSFVNDNAAVAIHAYLPNDEIPSVEDATKKFSELDGTASPIETTERIMQNDHELMKLTQADGTKSVMFMTPEKSVVQVLVLDFNGENILERIIETLRFSGQ